MGHVFFIQPSVGRNSGCFHILATGNSAAIYIGVHVSLEFLFFPDICPEVGIAGLYGNFSVSFLRNLHTIFHSGCTKLHSHQQCRSVLNIFKNEVLEDQWSFVKKDTFTRLLIAALLQPKIGQKLNVQWGLPGGAGGKESNCKRRRRKRHWFDSWVRKIPWSKAWQSTPVFLPGESHGQKSTVGYSP